MVRRSRWPTRISFILVIVMGMLGFLYAVATWLPALGAIDLAGFAEGIDWVEALAAIGEQALQLLLLSLIRVVLARLPLDGVEVDAQVR
jgi:uncharacterized membrane protein